MKIKGHLIPLDFYLVYVNIVGVVFKIEFKWKKNDQGPTKYDKKKRVEERK